MRAGRPVGGRSADPVGGGTVALVGAGPGDEGLLTLRGAELLRHAEVVVYDHLANCELLNHAPQGCETIYVGKQASAHTLSQADITELLVRKAKEGKRVVRLKGGDPFVFGRGGEEALALVEEGIGFEIVPGVTAGVAAAAYAGIPVTHRALASGVGFFTGNEREGKEESSIDWGRISTGVGTLVFYMGVANLPFIVSRLLENGRDPATPAAVIQWGTYNRQRTLAATLGDIVSRVEGQNLCPPALIVVGEVVGLREKLRWFDTRPLFGQRIVVTRSRAQASNLSRALRDFGADAVELPMISITPRADLGPLDRELAAIGSYSWIVLTSTNSVEIFFRRLLAGGRDCRSLGGAKIAVIGKETGESLLAFGLRPDLVPDDFTSEGAVEAFRGLRGGLAGKRVLIPGSVLARDVLPRELTAMGAEVTALPIYDNNPPAYSREQIEPFFRGGPVMVTFTSSSTVSHFVSLLKRLGAEDILKSVRGASIGPVTSGTARELGVPIAVEAGTHTIPGLVDAILRHCTEAGQ